MFVNNTELLNKLLQLESKIDQHKHKNDGLNQELIQFMHIRIESIEQKLTNIDSNITNIDSNISNIDSNITHIDSNITHIDSNITHIDSNITHIDSNITNIYFENQIIKHQLLLEDCIRESVNEIDDLSLLIKNTVSKINKLTEILLKNPSVGRVKTC
jgi:chromosome segregation ATPase